MKHMELSDETYGVIEDQYGEETAEYARKAVEDPFDSSFPALDRSSEEVGLEVNLDEYIEIRAEQGVEAALNRFSDDLDETREAGVLEILSAEAYDQEL